MGFRYKTLIITNKEDTAKRYTSLIQEMDIKGVVSDSSMDALSNLMDEEVDIILIDFSIGEEEALHFLNHISDDFALQHTPVVLLTDSQECLVCSDRMDNYNVISVLPLSHWHKLANKLLNYLKLQKTNVSHIQNSLVESENRGEIDPLTGAYNRYASTDVYYKLASRHKAYKEPFCILMLDIDHFKKINDTYGHDIGDEVLKEFTEIILDSTRKNDSLIRFGGEEFLLFLSNVDLASTKKIALNLRKLIKETLFSSKELQITSSFGLVEYKEGEDYESTLKRVDLLLYEAKTSGRDRIVSEDD